MNYYDEISKGYNELHKEEQLKKLKIILEEIKILKIKPTKTLDVGCGTGISSNLPGKVKGIDPSKELINIAKKTTNNSNTSFQVGEAESLPFKDFEFDLVISLTAAQNFNSIKKAIEEIKRVSKNNATIIVSILKKSKKVDELKKELSKNLNIKKTIEEDKDIIYITKKE